MTMICIKIGSKTSGRFFWNIDLAERAALLFVCEHDEHLTSVTEWNGSSQRLDFVFHLHYILFFVLLLLVRCTFSPLKNTLKIELNKGKREERKNWICDAGKAANMTKKTTHWIELYKMLLPDDEGSASQYTMGCSWYGSDARTVPSALSVGTVGWDGMALY